MKVSRLSNTVLLAFLLADTPLLLAEEDKTSDHCGVRMGEGSIGGRVWTEVKPKETAHALKAL
jgi:hypothetical protein